MVSLRVPVLFYPFLSFLFVLGFGSLQGLRDEPNERFTGAVSRSPGVYF